MNRFFEWLDRFSGRSLVRGFLTVNVLAWAALIILAAVVGYMVDD